MHSYNLINLIIYLINFSYIILFVTIDEWLTLIDVLVKLSCLTIHMTNRNNNNYYFYLSYV